MQCICGVPWLVRGKICKKDVSSSILPSFPRSLKNHCISKKLLWGFSISEDISQCLSNIHGGLLKFVDVQEGGADGPVASA